VQSYFVSIEGFSFTGDAASSDSDGDFWLVGRVDNVLDAARHRVITMEFDSVLTEHPQVAEVAVIGRSVTIRGRCLSRSSLVALVCSQPSSLHAY